MRYISFTKIITLALVLCSTAAAAQTEKQKNWNGRVGLSLGATPQYQGSKDHYANIFLTGRVNYNTWYLESLRTASGGALRLNLSPLRPIEIGPMLNHHLARDNDVDNGRVKKMRKIDDAYEVGGFVRLPNRNVLQEMDELALDAQIVTDVSGVHDGTLVTFGPTYAYNTNAELTIKTSLLMTYATDDYNKTYFGVNTRDSALSGLNTYSADGGFENVTLGLDTHYKLNERWGILGMAQYQQLLNDAGNSPVVKDGGNSSQFLVGAGVAYSF
ncbi:MAG: MipA/OmpV family protein [Holosporales bacterium]|jgi:outer membrane protein